MKKVLVVLLTFVMIVTGLLCLNPNVSEVNAASTANDHGTYVTVAKADWEEDEKGVPELEGYLFAGYFKSENCTLADRTSKNGAACAKFVKDDMLDVKIQVTNGVVQKSDVEDKDGNKVYEGKYVIRFVSSVESLNYSNIGFEVEYTTPNGETKTARSTSSKVFTRIDSTTGVVGESIDKYEFSPKLVGEDSKYFMTAKLPVEESNKDVTYKVRAFWKTLDGTEVMGEARCVSVNDSENDIVNMNTQAIAQLEVGTDYTATYGPNADGTGAEAATVEVLTSDADGNTNIRVTLATGDTATGLKSATKFIIKDAEGNQVATAVYRNYYTDKAGTADTSWWDVNPTATRFEIASVSDLYGLASVVNGKKDLFYQNEIHLVRSVEVNKGLAIRASETADGVAKWTGETVAWTPIGSGWNADFRGIFDGDDNTISGLYMSGGSSFVGLFGYAGINNGQNAEIANVRLTNSYFSTSYDNVGSIISYGYGVQRLENVYSDAVLVASTTSGNVGGLVGRLAIPDKAIKSGDDKAALDGPHMLYKNCWFDGEINSSSTGAVNIGGIMGALNNTYRLDMINCLYTGRINNASTSAYVGGLFSRNVNAMWMELTNCLTTGEFNVATNAKGGLFATAQHPTLGWLEMSNCYTSATKAWNSNGFSDYSAEDCQKTEEQLATADVNTLFPGNNGAWVNNVDDAQTPILSTFADWWKDKQYEAGLDTSWYDADESEYVITTASQLYGLAKLVNEGNTFAGKTIKLGADIALNKADSAIVKKWVKGTAIAENEWTPIGTSTNKFAGIFDGQGHTISGLYLKSTAVGAGLFGYTAETAVFKNFKFVDSYISSTRDAVGLVGDGSFASMENIYTNAVLETAGQKAGGFVGIFEPFGADNNIKANTTFNNCWFDGKVITKSVNAGGFIGTPNGAAGISFTNCLSTGSVQADYRAGGFIGWKNNYAWNEFHNCLSVASVTVTNSSYKTYWGAFYGDHNTSTYNTKLYNAYGIEKFVGHYSETTNPFETTTYIKTRDELIHADETTLFPVLTGETENAWVSDGIGWNNTDRGTPILVTFADWWIENVEHDEITVDTSWYNDNDTEFTLFDAADLRGLAYIANNKDDFTGKTVKLGNDIQINEVNADILASWEAGTVVPENNWTPIGTDAKRFNGTFDGQGFEISGLYLSATTEGAGLFGYTGVDSQFKNFKFVDSYMTSTSNCLGMIGVGRFVNIENIYTNVTIKGSGNLNGGFVGVMYNIKGDYAALYSNIRNCWFDGTITQTDGSKYGMGGFIGGTGGAAALGFHNCLSTGTVTGGFRVGGFYGWKNYYATLEAHNCLSVANVSTNVATNYEEFKDLVGSYFGDYSSNAYNVNFYNSYGLSGVRINGGTTASYATKFETSTFIKDRAYLINTDEATLFPVLTGETENAWVKDSGYNAVNRGTPILASFAEWWLARQTDTDLNEWADTSWYNDNDTEFVLTTQGQLYGLAQLGQTKTFAGKTIKLGKDIALNKVDESTVDAWKNGEQAPGQWKPLVGFAGTFDGQGNTISGLYLNATTASAGIFGTTTATAVIKNFKLVDSYMKSTGKGLGIVGTGTFASMENIYTSAVMVSTSTDVAGFAGNVATNGGTVLFDNCWFDGEIIHTGDYLVGGFVGEDAGATVITFNNCLNTGKITGTSKVGGFMGWANNYAVKTFNNCLSVGEYVATGSSTYCGTFFGQLNTSPYNFTVTNSYGVGDRFNGVYRAADTSYETKYESATYIKTRDYIVATDVATLFPGTNAWVNDNTNGWNNTDRGTPILATFADWWIENVEHDELVVDLSWYDEKATEFTLTTADELYSLSQASVITNFEGQTIKLGADIVLNEVDETILARWQEGTAVGENWMPIGTSSKPFAGTFDGQGHTISGLFHKSTNAKAGLFGVVAHGSVIRNFKLIDSYIYANGEVGIIGSGLASTIEKIYTNAIIESTANNAGGIMGVSVGHYTDKTVAAQDNWSKGVMVISECWFDGQINMKGSAYSAGGILGAPSQRSRIDFNDCLYTGLLTTERTDQYARLGGFIGWENASAQYNFTNCLSVGNFEAVNTSYVGGFIGNIGGDGASFTNCYTTYPSADETRVGIGFGSNAITYTNTEMKAREDLYVEVNTLFPNSTAWQKDGGYNDVDRGTPILTHFASWWLARQDEGKLTVAPSTAWYLSPETEGEYVIQNKGDLLGFLSLAKKGETFEGKTIKLGANITLNTPKVDEWAAGKAAPAYKWTPITFKGNFDGQGHSISGVYLKSNATYVGFFGQTAAGSTISNFRLIDSYIEQTAGAWSRFNGVVVGDACGNISNVYSNATIVSACNYVGGIAGRVQASKSGNGELTISNCWFDGDILLKDGIGYTGGIVGQHYDGQLNITNVLYTGNIKGKHTGNAFVGGIIGMTPNTVSGTTLESVVSAGTIDVENNASTKYVGAVVGYFYSGASADAKANYALNNVFANRAWGTPVTWGGGNGTLTGKVVRTSNGDRLLGYVPQNIAGASSAQKLDFTTNKTWTMRTNDVPVLTVFKDIVDVRTLVSADTNITSELGLGTVSGNFANAVAEAAGDYLVTVTGSKTTYDNYLAQLESLGFTKFVDNAGTTMATDGVYSATYVKGSNSVVDVAQWVVNVTHVNNEGKLYVSINSDVDSVANTLLDNDAKNPLGKESGTNAISLSLVEDIAELKITGNCFVFQLPNGHFIINDGNTNGGSGKILKAYLQSLVGEGNPIYIDAWVISHFHNDHGGALMDMVTDASLRENVYVDAFYVNEASMYAQTTFTEGGDAYAHTNSILDGARKLQRSKTNSESPVVYQVHMGQRYYLNGVTLDVVNTPEQLADENWKGTGTGAVPDTFNTSSVNIVYTLQNSGKRVLIGGDTTQTMMKYIMSAFGKNSSGYGTSQTLANINVFAAYHHGKNAINTYYEGTHVDDGKGNDRAHVSSKADNSWANYLLKNTNNVSGFTFDVMFFPNYKKYEATIDPSTDCGNSRGCDGRYVADDGAQAYPYNIGDINQYYADNATLHFTTGYQDMTSATSANPHGTVKITFNSNGMISWTAYETWHGKETYILNEFSKGSNGTATGDTDL